LVDNSGLYQFMVFHVVFTPLRMYTPGPKVHPGVNLGV
jgi:hypothetical protein